MITREQWLRVKDIANAKRNYGIGGVPMSELVQMAECQASLNLKAFNLLLQPDKFSSEWLLAAARLIDELQAFYSPTSVACPVEHCDCASVSAAKTFKANNDDGVRQLRHSALESCGNAVCGTTNGSTGR